ncbi:hypothetical protein HDEF_1763 [Candidatus Hamiltonella defensa 5AT (Acyrthosiphon pisum)]|uniref:Uncharacterized protein n=1 Tax=Hamiltonella defensa subsp. Acyrthosiphon pisum (strain 5AT) TaxID=572265 RepID=C4K716_HAMD5|nr:hypothetical protein HDEF_1763 [Candidatus Hamiltonella defensa 5AT (Acyrthosiphon pisum)]
MLNFFQKINELKKRRDLSELKNKMMIFIVFNKSINI